MKQNQGHPKSVNTQPTQTPVRRPRQDQQNCLANSSHMSKTCFLWYDTVVYSCLLAVLLEQPIIDYVVKKYNRIG